MDEVQARLLGQIARTEQRYASRRPQRESAREARRRGRPLDADTPERVEKRIRRLGVSRSEMADRIEARVAPSGGVPRSTEVGVNALERVLGENDLLGVIYLQSGLRASRSVGRVQVRDAFGRVRGYGTGFLVSPRLFLTNHHVLDTETRAAQSLLEMDYERDAQGRISATQLFSLEPATFFLTDPDLDYTFVAVSPQSSSGADLGQYGCNPLLADEGKLLNGESVSIVQHPGGEPKQVALRENRVVDVLDDFLHYKTDTAPGSSGSPVFNDQWEVVALHHSGVLNRDAEGRPLAKGGGLWDPSMGDAMLDWRANEGARVSRVLAHVAGRRIPDAWDALRRNLIEGTPRESDIAPHVVGPTPGGMGTVLTLRGDVATWSVPLQVSVRLGAPILDQGPKDPTPTPVSTPLDPHRTDSNGGSAGDVEGAVRELARQYAADPDVLEVRAGYVFENDWITDEHAVVIEVRPEVLRDGVRVWPGEAGRYPVQVVPASLEALARRGVRENTLVDEAFGLETLGLEGVPSITYTPPPGAELPRVKETMKVTCHVSPDDGWPVLEPFLRGTRRGLTIGMYDFTAPHVFERLKKSLMGKKETLDLVMQRGAHLGSGTKKDDIPEDQIVGKLRDQLGDRFRNAWASVRTSGALFATSYHIKVAVRDRNAFWLSSGNWQSSNLPDLDIEAEPSFKSVLRRYNRDWHVLIENRTLADVFKTYLRHDLAEARKKATPSVELLPDVFVPSVWLEGADVPLELEAEAKAFKARTFEKEVDVQPLLTPDNYEEHVLELIESAERTLYFQNQSLKPPRRRSTADSRYNRLLDALMQKQKDGLDVRIIFRNFDARLYLERLKERGFDVSTMRIQSGCHTKGIVVDSARVLVGSQNWSEHGTLVNRDASLIFHDEEIAAYYEQIFLHDWDVLARQQTLVVEDELLQPRLAAPGEDAPEGMVRIPWIAWAEG